MYGFFRVGAAVPKIRVADCDYNREQILRIIEKAAEEKVKAVVFPELALCGYTCGDLLYQKTLLDV